MSNFASFDARYAGIRFQHVALPVNRGIHGYRLVQVKKDVVVSDVASAFANAYDDKPFVHVCKIIYQSSIMSLDRILQISDLPIMRIKVLTVISVIDKFDPKVPPAKRFKAHTSWQGWHETEGLLMTPSYL